MRRALVSRRHFVQCGAAGLAAQALWPRNVSATSFSAPTAARAGVPDRLADLVDPTTVKQLALTAIDAAKATGATYADVRLTRVVRLGGTGGMAGSGRSGTEGILIGGDVEEIAIGVRCLVNGYWGFASSPYWRRDEASVLARHAAAQAKANAKTGPRAVEWTPSPPVTGDWTTPVKIDPFTVPMEERADFLIGLGGYVRRRRLEGGPGFGPILADPGSSLLGQLGARVWDISREERAVATTDGSFFTQTFYRTGTPIRGRMTKQLLGPTTQGWELFAEAKLTQAVEELESYYAWLNGLPRKAFELGRYDMIATGKVMANLVGATLGPATELDRALGFEASAGGTSYLGPNPLALLGTYQVGSPAVTLAVDQSMPGGFATVRWDDEGVVPEATPLVTDGILTDYQTTREQAGWLRPYYDKVGKPVRSHGCAGAQSALYTTMQSGSNLILRSAKDDVSEEALISGVKKGVYCFDGLADADFQCNSGRMDQMMGREIINGKLGPILADLGEYMMLFTSREMWKIVSVVGGSSTAERVRGTRRKGRPEQTTYLSIEAPAARLDNVVLARV